jgi:hypothetical protein
MQPVDGSVRLGERGGRAQLPDPKLDPGSDQVHLELNGTYSAANRGGNLRVGKTLEFPEDDTPKVIGETVKEPLDFFEHDDFLFRAGLSSVDMLEHPPWKDRRVGMRILAIGAFTTNIATGGAVTMCGVNDLAHRDSYQEFPKFLAARGTGLALELAETKARVHALEHVLLVFAPANAIIEVPPHEHLQPRRESFPDDASRLVALVAIG